jgi:two-component system, chemotaxis family, chemotaxis protein CheY
MPDKTILIVEDNEIQREGLAIILRQEGYTVLLAARGRDAVTILELFATPDLILLDMMIPPPDGWHLMAMLNKDSALASVPVVIMTALGIATEEWASSLGACGLIRKPVDTEPLLAEIRRCLGEGQG